jgi:hypothetical protein
MRKLLTLAMASAAAFAMPTVASAQALTVDGVPGTPLSYQIFGIKDVGNPVYGSAPTNTTTPSVRFDATTNINMDIGNGAAIIKDASATPSWTLITINPDLDFTALKFDISTTAEATVQLYYILAGGGTSDANYPSNYVTTCATCTLTANGNDNHFLFNGGTFNGVMLQVQTTGAFIYTVKQMSFTPAGTSVPEPATWGLMLLGFGGMGMALRRSRRRGKQNLMQIA